MRRTPGLICVLGLLGLLVACGGSGGSGGSGGGAAAGLTLFPSARRVNQNQGHDAYAARVAACGETVHVVWKDDRDGTPAIYMNRVGP